MHVLITDMAFSDSQLGGGTTILSAFAFHLLHILIRAATAWESSAYHSYATILQASIIGNRHVRYRPPPAQDNHNNYPHSSKGCCNYPSLQLMDSYHDQSITEGEETLSQLVLIPATSVLVPPVSLGGDNEFQSGPQIPSSHPPPPGSSISRSPTVSTMSPFPLFYIHGGGARWRTGGRSWLLIITGRLLRAAQCSINQQRVIKCVWNECRQRTCRATHTRDRNGGNQKEAWMSSRKVTIPVLGYSRISPWLLLERRGGCAPQQGDYYAGPAAVVSRGEFTNWPNRFKSYVIMHHLVLQWFDHLKSSLASPFLDQRTCEVPMPPIKERKPYFAVHLTS